MKLFNLIPIRSLVVCICLCFASFHALADDETRNFRAYSAVFQIPGAFIESVDDKYTSGGSWASGFTILNNKTIIELGLESEKHRGHTYFKTKATFDLALTNASHAVTILTGQQLEINYDPAERTRYTDKAQLIFYGYYKVRVYNVTFQTVDAANSLMYNATPEDVYIQAEISTNKAYPFTLASTALTANQYNKTIIGASNELKINWDFVKGANEYELEYTYVDDYDFNSGTFASSAKSPGSITYNLRNDGTRVLTPFNFYRIPLNYERGYIIYRIRPVARDASGGRIDGAWTGIPENGNVQNLLSSFPNSVYALTTAFSSNINWVSTKTFAETGKTGTGISFADATGLVRQKIARLNTDNKSIVQSTLYDHYGRPKYSILPAPVTGLDFTYRQNLNKVFNGSSMTIFDKKVFDLCSSNNPCSNASFMLDAAASDGAAKYYSTSNANKNSQQGFIPDARGLPYAEVKYTPDLTGRILKQSLPGSTHHTGALTGKAIQYFYSHPSQIEVDRLFGKEAGPVSKYTKNFVIDPNGQTSCSYIDRYGRTVATALMGDEPPGMDPAPDNSGLIDLVEDMAIPATNIVDLTNHCIEVNTSFFVPAVNTQEVFVYKTTLGKFFPDICNGGSVICLDCAYDLEISIKDACGNDLFFDHDNNPLTNPNPVMITIGASPDAVTNKFYSHCISGEYTGPFPGSITKTGLYEVSSTPITIVFPRVGTYSIYKKICVSDKATQDYAELYESQGSLCSSKYCTIVDSIIGSINFGTCSSQMSCQACIESINTYTDNPNNPVLTQAQLNTLMGNCELKCPLSTCGKMEKMLAADFVPGGFFAATDPSDPNWGFSIFNVNNALQVTSGLGSSWNNPPFLSGSNHPYLNNFGTPATTTIGGTVFYPEALTMQQFTANFELSWAYAFVPVHPEYCKMKFWCDVAGTSKDYDQNMQKLRHYSEACSGGYLMPYQTTYAYGPTSCPFTNDPIFPVANPLYTSLINALIAELTTNYGGTGKNIYEVVSEDVYGGTIPTGHVFGGDPCMKDQEWQTFMESYLTLKAQLYDDMLVIYLQNFNSSGIGECGTTLPPDYETKFPDNSDLLTLYGFDPNWTAPANTTQLNGAVTSNATSQCQTQCASYIPLWDSELSSYCLNYSNLTQLQKDDILNAFEAICNLGCDANHVLGSSSTPGAGVFYTLPGTSTHAFNFQDVLDYYMNLYQSNTCSSYLVSEPAPYSNSNLQGSASTILNDCKCDQILKVNFDLAQNQNVPSGITEAWQLFKHRYGFDLPEYNPALCLCNEAIHQQGLALPVPNSNLIWTPAFQWDATSLNFLASNPLDIDGKLSCNRCVSCDEVSQKMDALFNSLPYSGLGVNVYYAIKNNAANAAYLTNNLNINNNWTYSTTEYLGFYNACSEYTSNSSYSNLLTQEASDLTNYLDELAGNGFLSNDHTMKLCTDSKFFTSSLYKEALPVPVSDIYDYDVTPTGNALQIVIKLNTVPKCTMNLTLPTPYVWSNIKSVTGIIANITTPVSPGIQYGFKLYAFDHNFQQIVITGTSCYPISNLTGSSPYFPVSCPVVPPENKSCQVGYINSALQAAADIYEQFKASNTAQFVKDYKAVCLGRLNETFTREYQLQEFHYTLYYYDEAGNLQRTVAPKGVVPLNISTNTPPTNLYPAHSSVNCVDNNYVNEIKFNTLNQPLTEKTVDGGPTAYFYERTGRLVASQNAKQAGTSLANGTFIYSYTLYDKSNRITETGEMESATILTQAIIDEPYVFPPTGAVTFTDFCTQATKREIVNTFYDIKHPNPSIQARFTGGAQKNLRNRVSYSFYRDTYTPAYNHATFYSYDEHGNVTEVVQHNKALETKYNITASLKKLSYEYELISGNMNKVTYQAGEPDQFMHKYHYDDDNRLHEVFTSKDDLNWDRDAKYFYYEHGPLARIERADEQVQGMDYFFTIHGWIKGINSDILGINNDAGKDAAKTNAYNSNNADLHAWFAKDAMAYSLNYYHTGTQKDYEAINRGSYTTGGNLRNPLSDYTNILVGGPFHLTSHGADLYNGNISSMVTSFIDKDPLSNDHADNTAFPQLTGYRYDQLQRITQMMSYRTIAANAWNGSSSANYDGSYLMRLSYDKNGNIGALTRDGAGATIKAGSLLPMDDLTYTYAEQGVSGTKNTNQLIHVKDAATASAYTDDIKAPATAFATPDYAYDEIGNLVNDKNEYIATIEWTVDRKVKKITRDVALMTAASVTKPDIEYEYNAQRQRVTKIVKPRDPATKALMPTKDWLYTYYVYDAGGNVAAVYDRHSEPYVDPQSTPNLYRDALKLSEHHLYGSDRLAINRPALPYEWAKYFINCGGALGECQNASPGFDTPPALSTANFKRNLGYKEFELNNHLGNVIATVSDRKLFEWGSQLFHDNFSAGPNSWSNSTITGGQLVVTTNVQYLGAEKVFATTVGKTYRVRFTATIPAGAVIQGEIYPFPVAPPFVINVTAVNGYNEFVFSAVTPQTLLKFQKANAPGTMITYSVDDVIVDEVLNYTADVLMHTDYYAFGQQMPGRTWQGISDDYRFGFNMKEKDNEIYGNANSYDFGARVYDPRIGRWSSRDPLYRRYPFSSPYVGFGNNSIFYIDPGGETLKVATNDPKLKDAYRAMVSKVFSGKVKANISNDNYVTFEKVSALTPAEEGFFNMLKTVENHNEVTEYTLVQNDPVVTTGDYFGSRIDIADILAHDDGKDLITGKEVLAHESYEQMEKAIMLSNPENEEEFKMANERDGFDYGHNSANSAQSNYSRIDRSYSIANDAISGITEEGLPTTLYSEENVRLMQPDNSYISGRYEYYYVNGDLFRQTFIPYLPQIGNPVQPIKMAPEGSKLRSKF